MNFNSSLKKRNPFEILGLSPKIVKECDEETLFKLVKAAYRVLQLAYHPDRGGDPKKAMEINLAFELINLEKNPESFRSYRKKYIERLSRKTLQTKIEELEAQNRKLSFYNELLKEKFWQFLEERFEELHNLFEQNKGLCLKIFDVVAHSNFSHLRYVKKQMFFKDLIIFKNFVLKRKSYEKLFRMILKYKYLGTIKREYIEPWVLLERDLQDENAYLRNFIKKETFIKECLIFLNTEVQQNSYVFFYQEEETQKVVLEGIIIKKEEIEVSEISKILKTQTIKDKKSDSHLFSKELVDF
jgi:curved DNA-binding protein CbpA